MPLSRPPQRPARTYTSHPSALLRRIAGIYRACALAPAATLLASLLGLSAPIALAQNETPIYVNDSPSAETAISRALEMASVGNVSEAISVLQRTLAESPHAVTPTRRDPNLFISVRERINTILLEDPARLDRYRTLQKAEAEALYRAGQFDRVEREYLLTTAGCDAALRIAQRQIEDARFQAAALTLLQLDRHPDRADRRAEQALKLLELATRYFGDTPQDRPLAVASEQALERWADQLGRQAPETSRITQPPSPPVLSAFEQTPPVSLDGMLSRPLASDALGGPNDLLQSVVSRYANRRLPERALVLHAIPTLYRDQVIINDSVSISSWNRFTLKLNWRTRVEAPIIADAMGTSFGVDDLSSVQVVDGVVVAVTGLSLSGRSAPERYIIAIDADTGRRLWGTTLADLAIPELAGSVFRGRPSIDQGVIILNTVRHSREQRVISSSVLGLDLHTGRPLWNRLAASIGVQPYGWNVPAVDASTAGSGLTFRTDTVGVTTAFESATGRVRWVRRHAADGMYTTRTTNPWMNNRPIIHAGLLYTLSPAGDRIVALAPLTGELQSSQASSSWGTPGYLLSSGDHIIAVSEDHISARRYDASLFQQPAANPRQPAEIYAAGPRGIRGRVIPSGDRLIIPTDSGVSIVDIPAALAHALDPNQSPEAPPIDIRLEHPGQIAVDEGQIVVADDYSVHSYSLWSVADRYLSQAMQADPTDPDPAITFAELSYQADQGEAILPAVDHALRALASDPLSDANDASRTRLFRVILEMISPQRADRAIIVRLSDDTRAELINRLSLTASTPTERVAYLMAAGSYFESAGDIRQAIDMYQRTLESDEFASATVRIDGTGVPAGVEATRRMRRLIADRGRDAYALYDAEALRARAQLPDSPQPQDFESIARRYPLAEITPELWTRAGEAYLDSQRVPLAVFALEEAATAAEIIWPEDDPRVAEVYSRVIAMMLQHGRINSALDRIRRAQQSGIELSVMIDGTTLGSEQLREFAIDLAQRRQRRPAIGADLSPGSTLEGWVVAKLESPAQETRTDRIVMRRTDSRIGVFAPSQERDSLVQLWGDVRDELPLRIEGDRLILATVLDRADNVDHIIRCRDLDTGEILWDSAPFRAQFQLEPLSQPEVSRIPSVQTPLRSRVRMNEITYNFDGGLMVLFERSGRALALDLSDGRTLWSRTELMDVVHDVDAAAGIVVVAGSNLVGEQWFDVNHRPEERAPIVHVLEARTGRTLHTSQEDRSAVRWVRVTPEAEAILGTEAGILALDAHRGMVRWRNESDALLSSRTALPMLGKLLVRAADNSLWFIDPATGSTDPQPIDVRGRLDRGFGRIEIADLTQHFAVSTERGVVILDRQAQVVGADTHADETMVIPAAFGNEHFVHITRDGAPVDPSFYRYRLTVFSLPGAAAVAESAVDLQGDPSSVALLDDLIIVSAYRNSVIIKAPGPEDLERAPLPEPSQIRPVIGNDEPDEAEPQPEEKIDVLTPFRPEPTPVQPGQRPANAVDPR